MIPGTSAAANSAGIWPPNVAVLFFVAGLAFLIYAGTVSAGHSWYPPPSCSG